MNDLVRCMWMNSKLNSYLIHSRNPLYHTPGFHPLSKFLYINYKLNDNVSVLSLLKLGIPILFWDYLPYHQTNDMEKVKFDIYIQVSIDKHCYLLLSTIHLCPLFENYH